MTSLVAAALATAAWLATPLAAQNGRNDREAEAALQAAINREVIDGKLQDAIAQYTKLIERHAGSRAVAAKALFQMGQAHEKLGSAEARKAYERIGREFADQKDVAADAGRRLAAMNGGPVANRDQPRSVSNPGDSAHFSVSFDGRWLAGVAWGSNDNHLVVQDVVTGESKQLVAGLSPTYSADPMLSPDGKLVAFAWSDRAENGGQGQLKIVANETGAKPRLLLRDRESWVVPCAWSWDGKSILVYLNKRNRTEFGWVSVADGSLRILKSMDYQRIENLSLSPDGRYIAYSALPTTNPNQSLSNPARETELHVYVVAADGTKEVTLIKTAAANRAPMWTPDGRNIVFVSNLSGKSDLWSVPVRDGHAAGAASIVKRDVGTITPKGMTRTGAYYYLQTTARVEQITVAELLPGGRSRTLESFVGMHPSWSPDGEFLAIKRHSTQAMGLYNAVIRSVKTGHETRVSDGFLQGEAPEWLSDSKRLLSLMRAPGNGPPSGWFLIDVQTGVATSTPIQIPGRSGIATLSPDGQTLYQAARKTAGENAMDRILAVNVATGEERQVCALPGQPRNFGTAIAVSPDGKSLAIATIRGEARLARVGVDGSDFRELYGPYRAYGTRGKLAWSNDGRSILFATTSEDSANKTEWQIMRISADGGAPEFTGLAMKQLGTFSLSKDGSRIAYDSYTGIESREVMAIDNLPALLSGVK